MQVCDIAAMDEVHTPICWAFLRMAEVCYIVWAAPSAPVVITPGRTARAGSHPRIYIDTTLGQRKSI